jgi:hypothetical protein
MGAGRDEELAVLHHRHRSPAAAVVRCGVVHAPTNFASVSRLIWVSVV